MGYLGNQLATVVTGAFAAVLTGLWPYFVDFAPILNFIFIMAVPITWFLTLMCWLSQKSADYVHRHAPTHHTQDEKKSFSTTGDRSAADSSVAAAAATAGGQTVQLSGIREIQKELSMELDGLKESVKLKDDEIERLNREIANLQTLVQIESLRAELANLKMLASKRAAGE